MIFKIHRRKSPETSTLIAGLQVPDWRGASVGMRTARDSPWPHARDAAPGVPRKQAEFAIKQQA